MRTTVITAALLSACMLPAQDLTPRQLFYKDDAATQPAAPPKAAPKPTRQTAPRPKTETPPPAAPAPPPPAGATVSTPAPPAPVPLVTNATYVQGGRPVGLRYALVQVSNGAEKEVSPNGTFHSGDMVRVKVEGNRDGYLYVIARGSSGNWKPLFPSLEINHGENRISPHQRYSLPSATHAFTFDEQTGQEQLFLIYSPEPIHDMDSLVPSLAPPEHSDAPLIVLSAGIDDDLVSHLRQTYSRDLIVQTVTPSAPDAQTTDPLENAVYIVNKSGGRVVADIRLEHQ